MTNYVYMVKEWHGAALPLEINIQLPSVADLVRMCDKEHPKDYNMGLAYPPQAPVLWIKYGYTIVWNELYAQKMANEELRRLGSSVRAPAVYYACRVKMTYEGNAGGMPTYRSYVVMDYVPGKTAGQLLQNLVDNNLRSYIYAQIAVAISELYRIPVPQGSRPAAVSGGRIRHGLFDQGMAPFHYENVAQLQEHLNLFLMLIKSQRRIRDMVSEPLIFCYSDIWLDNFIIDENGRVVVIDFEDASILPASFANFVLASTRDKIKRNIRPLVHVPMTDGVDNTKALYAIFGPMVQGAGSFAKAGRQRLGLGTCTVHKDPELHQLVTDKHGRPLVYGLPSNRRR